MLIPAVGFSLFPKAGIPQFLITVDTPEGSSIDETDDAVRYVERTLQNSGAVKYYFSNVGKGNPRVYYNIVPRGEISNAGEVLAELKHFDADRSPVFIDSLRTVFAGHPNAHIRVQEFENGPPLDAPIAVRLIGDNLNSLSALARTVESILEQTDGTMYVGIAPDCTASRPRKSTKPCVLRWRDCPSGNTAPMKGKSMTLTSRFRAIAIKVRMH
jgi:multidrug efflux pump subunit AcrB